MGWIIFLIALVLLLGGTGLVYFLYKRRSRGAFARTFSENLAGNELQLQIEDTGNAIIRKLEEQIKHIEYLLEESDAKMSAIDGKMQELTKILNQAQNTVLMHQKMPEVQQKPPLKTQVQSSFYKKRDDEAEQGEMSIRPNIKDEYQHNAEEFVLPVKAVPNQVYQAYNQAPSMSQQVQEIVPEINDERLVKNGNSSENYDSQAYRGNEDVERNMLFNASQTRYVSPLPSRSGNYDKSLEMKKLVLAMDEQGYDAAEISKTTGMAKGEVSLILQLNKK